MVDFKKALEDKNDKEKKRLKQLLNKTSGKKSVPKEELEELDLLIRKYWNNN